MGRVMKTLIKMKEKTKKLKSEVTAIYYVYQNPNTKLLPKIIIIITIGYALSPIDLIPDFIPVLGYLDDLVIIPVLITLSIKLIPNDIMIEARQKALQEPIKLKKNWILGSLFILIWIIIITVIIFSFVRLLVQYSS